MAKDNHGKSHFETYGFGKVNLYVLLASLLLLIIGYVLMSGGASEDGVSFNPEVFSAMRIKVAPIVCMLGFVGIAVAILYRKRSSYGATEETVDQDKDIESK